jgi:hypothetical protein
MDLQMETHRLLREFKNTSGSFKIRIKHTRVGFEVLSGSFEEYRLLEYNAV